MSIAKAVKQCKELICLLSFLITLIALYLTVPKSSLISQQIIALDNFDNFDRKYAAFYMQNIRLPPTREDVLKETLKRSQAVAKEFGDKYTVVTYDLSVAKIARQIQIQNFPEFDD